MHSRRRHRFSSWHLLLEMDTWSTAASYLLVHIPVASSTKAIQQTDSYRKCALFLLEFDKRLTMIWLAILNFGTKLSSRITWRLFQWQTAPLSGAHVPTGNDLCMWFISVVACHHPLTFPKGCATIVVIMMIMTMWWQTDRSTAVDAAAAPSVAVGIEFTKRTKSADNESRTE